MADDTTMTEQMIRDMAEDTSGMPVQTKAMMVAHDADRGIGKDNTDPVASYKTAAFMRGYLSKRAAGQPLPAGPSPLPPSKTVVGRKASPTSDIADSMAPKIPQQSPALPSQGFEGASKVVGSGMKGVTPATKHNQGNDLNIGTYTPENNSAYSSYGK